MVLVPTDVAHRVLEANTAEYKPIPIFSLNVNNADLVDSKIDENSKNKKPLVLTNPELMEKRDKDDQKKLDVSKVSLNISKEVTTYKPPLKNKLSVSVKKIEGIVHTIEDSFEKSEIERLETKENKL